MAVFGYICPPPAACRFSLCAAAPFSSARLVFFMPSRYIGGGAQTRNTLKSHFIQKHYLYRTVSLPLCSCASTCTRIYLMLNADTHTGCVRVCVCALFVALCVCVCGDVRRKIWGDANTSCAALACDVECQPRNSRYSDGGADYHRDICTIDSLCSLPRVCSEYVCVLPSTCV